MQKQATQTPAPQKIRRLTCCCCGTDTRGRQWHNRDTGFGICPSCVQWIAEKESAEDMRECYGVAGVHHSID